MLARLATAGFLAVAAGCATPGPSPHEAAETIDRAYKTSAVVWSEGGHLIFLTKVAEHDGKLRLCGAYGPTHPRSPAAAHSREVADSASLRLDQTQVAQGLGFLAPHDGSLDPLGQPAACRTTDLDWRPEFASASTRLLLGRRSF